ncbi:MAG: hypothetical protein HZA54_01295, partial [Planctomycetes bacterium]|nr:hypothetical protein [Planctomycetota bacterium]
MALPHVTPAPDAPDAPAAAGPPALPEAGARPGGGLSRGQAALVLVLVLVGLALRAALILALAEHPFLKEPVGDAGYYDRWAQEIAAGDVWGRRVFLLDPLYPYLLGLVYRLFGRDLVLARLLQAALGVGGA